MRQPVRLRKPAGSPARNGTGGIKKWPRPGRGKRVARHGGQASGEPPAQKQKGKLSGKDHENEHRIKKNNPSRQSGICGRRHGRVGAPCKSLVPEVRYPCGG